jgi:hypothetical protein
VEIDEFIGIWRNEFGNILEIRPNNKDSLKVNFISGSTGKPVIREYFDNKESIDLYAELDYYESSLVVELWEKGKGFQLLLLYDWIEFKDKSGYYLAPGLSQYLGENMTEQYGQLFMPFGYYEKDKNSL